MAFKGIPASVRRIAEEEGFNSAAMVHRDDKASYYSLSRVDQDGFVLPIGLPVIVSVFANDGDVSIFSGKDALRLTSSFNLEE